MKKEIFNSIAYLLVFVGIQCGVTLGVQWAWRKLTGNTDITAMQMIVSMAVSSLVTLAVFVAARWVNVTGSYLKTRPWDVVAWCAVAAMGAVVPSAWLQELLPDLTNTLSAEFDMILRDRWGYMAVGLLAPVAEEVVFRGAILAALLRAFRSHWVAIGLSAVLFAVVHFNPAQMPHALLVGLLLGWMYYRTGSIVPSVTYHWVNNTIAYIIYNIMPNPDAHLIDYFGGSDARALMAVGCSLCILLPAIFQLNIRMKTR